LILGVADVQMQYQPPKDSNKVEQHPWVGFAAVLTMCLTSAVAGKFNKKIYKLEKFARIFLFLIEVCFSSKKMQIKDLASYFKRGLFSDYTVKEVSC
jgi:hypothetical protein